MSIEKFLANYDPSVKEVCTQLRVIVKELLPASEEVLFEGWKNISYGTGESHAAKDMIVYIAPLKDSVNLGFYRGALLPDASNQLKGTGKLLRHVKIKSINEDDVMMIKSLISEARSERIG